MSACRNEKKRADLLLILTRGRFLLAEREGLEPPDGFPYRFSRPRRCRLRSTSPFFGCRTWNRTTRAFWVADLQSALAPYEIIRHPSWLRRQDLNPRPSAYEADELPDCSTAQFVVRRTHLRLPATHSDRIGLEPISPDGWNCITIWSSMSTVNVSLSCYLSVYLSVLVLLYVYVLVLVYFLQS